MDNNKENKIGAEESNMSVDGVVIPDKAVSFSKEKKKAKKKTLAQLPVYRDVSNLKYIITSLICKSPNKLRGYYDEELSNISEISKSIGFANIARNVDERVWYINCALVLVYEIKRDFVILARLNILTDKDLSNKSKSLIKGIIAQLIGWRDYTIAEGVESRRSDKSQS